MPTALPSSTSRAPLPRRGVTLALAATLLWSTTGIFLDPLLTRYHLAPVQVSFWRTSLVALALALLLAWRHPASLRLSQREAPYYSIYGLVGIGLFNVIWSTSVQVNKAAVATALIYSAPIFVALAARPLFGERVTRAQGGAIALDVLGCALVAGIANPQAVIAHPSGLGWGLASGANFAIYTLLGRGAGRLGQRPALSILFHNFAIAALGLGLWGLATEGAELVRPALDGGGWALLLGLSLGPTLGGYACFTASLRLLPAAVASLFTTLEPPLTAALAFVLLGRAMTVVQWAGVGIIVGAVLLMQRGAQGRQPFSPIAGEHGDGAQERPNHKSHRANSD